ncbi:hypothetical protein DFJ63DRAFT_24721 [Scheffersomyces coipomensis]|uniref:uncharacterized protein n=1 Tax=Scheffersomyces coipomensis TaxID=1788519 RepID=UPI00315C5401
MSHPAASIKSIFSGKVNLDTPDDLDPFEYANSGNNTSFDTYDDSEDINVGDTDVGDRQQQPQQRQYDDPLFNSSNSNDYNNNDNNIIYADHNSTTISNKANPRTQHHHQHQYNQFDSDFTKQDPPDYDDEDVEIDDDGSSRDGSNYSITSKNLRTLSESYAPGDVYDEQEEIDTGKKSSPKDPRHQRLIKPFPQVKPTTKTFTRNSDTNISSTNISLASTGSDYQREYTDENEDYLMTHVSNANSENNNRNNNFLKTKEDDLNFSTPPPSDYLQTPDPFARSLSRNSTTSCLSTTATKDGIEGKRLHRHGPTTYSSNIISNMIHSQQQQQQQQQQQRSQPSAPISTGSDSTALNNNLKQYKSPLSTSNPKSSIPEPSPSQTPMRVSTTDSILQDNDQSEYSMLTTQAELDGEPGLGGERSQRIFEHNLPKDYKMPPPVTLNEKINLINTDSITGKK